MSEIEIDTTARYFVSADGTYIGCFAGAEPPSGAIEVPEAPEHYLQRWTGSTWTAPPAPVRTVHVAWFKAALAQMGKLATVDAAVAGLSADKRALWQFASNINDADADVKGIASALQIDLAAVFDLAEQIRAGRGQL